MGMMSNEGANSDLTSGENEDFSARPNRVPWPPILLVFCIFDGWITGKLMPVVGDFSMVNHFFVGEAQVWLGRLIIAAAIGVDLWVLAIFKSHRTNIRPDRPAEALVTSGPFAYSRNPIYVGNVMIILVCDHEGEPVVFIVSAIFVFLRSNISRLNAKKRICGALWPSLDELCFPGPEVALRCLNFPR